MAQKGVSLIKAAFDTDNFLMRFSEKVFGYRDSQSSFCRLLFTHRNDWSS